MDPYSDPDQQSEATIQAMVARLNERGNHAFFQGMIRNYAADLPRDVPLRVLDLGCGTGVVLRWLEGVLHPDSMLHGADVSQRLLDAAAEASAPDSRIHWRQVPTSGLPYPDESFDVITMHTLLSHVPEPTAILRDAARILSAAGRLIVFDADHASTTYGLPDYELMRDIDHRLTRAIATQPDICRQLPRYLKQSGFKLVSHESKIVAECGRGDFWLSSVVGFSRLIPSLGILSEAECEMWVAHMLQSHEDGTFFAAGSYYTFFAERA